MPKFEKWIQTRVSFYNVSALSFYILREEKKLGHYYPHFFFFLMNQTKRVGSETSLSLIYLLLNYVNVLYFLKNKINRENKVNPKIENRLKLITLTRYQIGYIITQ